MEGYVRVVEEHAEKFAKLSGRNGCFFERLSREQKKPLVQWVPRKEDETSSTYFSRVEREAKEAGQPMVFRKGGRDSLGTKYLTGTPTKVPVSWELNEISRVLDPVRSLQCSGRSRMDSGRSFDASQTRTGMAHPRRQPRCRL